MTLSVIENDIARFDDDGRCPSPPKAESWKDEVRTLEQQALFNAGVRIRRHQARSLMAAVPVELFQEVVGGLLRSIADRRSDLVRARQMVPVTSRASRRVVEPAPYLVDAVLGALEQVDWGIESDALRPASQWFRVLSGSDSFGWGRIVDADCHELERHYARQAFDLTMARLCCR